MQNQQDKLCELLLKRLHEVRHNMGNDSALELNPGIRLADAVDSMGLVEYVAVIADDLGVPASTIENSVGKRFGSVLDLAKAMLAAGIVPGPRQESKMAAMGPSTSWGGEAWISNCVARLPRTVQLAGEIDALVGRPEGWLQNRAGIRQRRIWSEEDPLAAAAECGKACLDQAAIPFDKIGALLVTSEAPPQILGLAGALHQRIGLLSNCPAIEIGGACTGFLAALWLAQSMLGNCEVVLVLSVEAVTSHLKLRPGTNGEAAALFGDGAASVLVTRQARNSASMKLRQIAIETNGAAGHLLQIERSADHGTELLMNGMELAGRAIHAMADSVTAMAARHGLKVGDLEAVVAHGGNGRMPDLLARKLGVPPDRVWSDTAMTGNLGSASLPVAWASRAQAPNGPVIWTAVGAGLMWGSALLDQ